MNTRTTPLAAALALIACAGAASRLQARPDDGPPLAPPKTTEAAAIPLGFYAGTCLNPALSAAKIPFRAEVTQVAGKNLARLICRQPNDNCYEDWVWDGASLTVTRHVFIPGNQMPDGRMREEVTQVQGYMSGGHYRVISENTDSMDCGTGLLAGSYLTIARTGDGFRCEVCQRRMPQQPEAMAVLRTYEFAVLK